MKSLTQSLLLVSCLLLMFSCKNNTEKADSNTNETNDTEVTTGADGAFGVNPDNSLVNWEGSKPSKTHNGTIRISGGKLEMKNGQITAGEFILDMNTITNLDLEGEWKEKLEAHLKGTAEGKSNDFFNVAQFPTGTLVVNKSTKLEGNPEANTLIYGDLTLKGISKPISFKANIDVKDNRLTAHVPKFTIDRTEWDIKFMSKKFFDDLKDQFINDDIGLSITLVADSI